MSAQAFPQIAEVNVKTWSENRIASEKRVSNVIGFVMVPSRAVDGLPSARMRSEDCVRARVCLSVAISLHEQAIALQTIPTSVKMYVGFLESRPLICGKLISPCFLYFSLRKPFPFDTWTGTGDDTSEKGNMVTSSLEGTKSQSEGRVPTPACYLLL